MLGALGELDRVTCCDQPPCERRSKTCVISDHQYSLLRHEPAASSSRGRAKAERERHVRASENAAPASMPPVLRNVSVMLSRLTTPPGSPAGGALLTVSCLAHRMRAVC